MHKDKFKIRITVGFSYIRKHSWQLACFPIFSIWVSSKKFQNSDIGWPLQPPTENMLRFNMIFFMIPPNIFFSQHQNKAEFKVLDHSEVLSSDFPVLRTSVASMTSSIMTKTDAIRQDLDWLTMFMCYIQPSWGQKQLFLSRKFLHYESVTRE